MEAGPCLESHHKDYTRMYWRMSVAMAIVAAVQVLNAHKVVNTPASFVASLIRQNIRRKQRCVYEPKREVKSRDISCSVLRRYASTCLLRITCRLEASLLEPWAHMPSHSTSV